MSIDPSIITAIFVVAAVLGVIDGLTSAADREPDPLDLARPSIAHLEAEAHRAAEELRQLERGGE